MSAFRVSFSCDVMNTYSLLFEASYIILCQLVMAFIINMPCLKFIVFCRVTWVQRLKWDPFIKTPLSVCH